MNELKYIDKIRREESLLSLPQSLSHILTMVGGDDFSMEDLSSVILKDPGLTSRILKMANSSIYRHQSEISTVHQAVMMLGIMQVKCLALSASVFNIGSIEKKSNVNFSELFSRFISVALGCKKIGALAGMDDSEELFIAGLLTDIGMVFFLHHFPDDYKDVVKNVHKYPSLTEAEKNILGIDHGAIGQMLAEKWKFPQVLCDAIGSHHRLPEKIGEISMVNVVQLSELINCPIIEVNTSAHEDRILSISRLAKMMNIDRIDLGEITASILHETIETAQFMGIDIGEPLDVMGRANRELLHSYMTIENLFRERQELSQRILIEERRVAAMETKNMAIATMSHYLSNAGMAISGRAQLIKMLMKKGSVVDKNAKLDPILDVIEMSVKKINAVLNVLRELTDIESMEKYSQSKALNIDDRIQEELKAMEKDSGVVIPQHK